MIFRKFLYLQFHQIIGEGEYTKFPNFLGVGLGAEPIHPWVGDLLKAILCYDKTMEFFVLSSENLFTKL